MVRYRSPDFKDTHNFCPKVLKSNRYSTRMLRRAYSCLLVKKGICFSMSSVCLPLLPDQVHDCSFFNFSAMGFDLVVLVLSTIGLRRCGRPSLWKLLFRDGIIYFVIAFSANLIVVVFLLLNLNPIMDVMFFLPAACITASVATRSFVRLNTHLTSNTHIQLVPFDPP